MSVPNLHQIRSLYVNSVMANSAEEDHLRAKRRSQALAEFDSWLAGVRAEAWEEGYRAEAYYPPNAPWVDAKNPYRSADQ